MSRSEIVGGIEAVLTITQSNLNLFLAISETCPGPATFAHAGAKLPLIHEVLKTVQKSVRADQESRGTLGRSVQSTTNFVSCRNRAMLLQNILKDISSESSLGRVKQVAAKESEIESLVKGLTENVHFLASIFALRGTESQAEETLALLRQLIEEGSSAQGRQGRLACSSFGNSTQHIFGDFSPQIHNTGAGKVIVAQSVTLQERDDEPAPSQKGRIERRA